MTAAEPASELPVGLAEQRSGTYRMADQPPTLRLHLAQAGWDSGILMGSKNRTAVLRGIGQVLEFPDYYGANLDALWDCLTDLTEPTALVWHHWQDFAAEHPRDWAMLRTLLTERMAEKPPFALILIG